MTQFIVLSDDCSLLETIQDLIFGRFLISGFSGLLSRWDEGGWMTAEELSGGRGDIEI